MAGRILIVDDNVTRRITLAARLSGGFFDIRVASSDVEALELLIHWTPSAILVADELDCVSASQFVRSIRGDAQLGDTTIFVLTAPGAQTGRSELLTAGADEVMPRNEPEEVFRARLRSHDRAQEMIDTLKQPGDGFRMPGLGEPTVRFRGQLPVTVIAPDEALARSWRVALQGLAGFQVSVCALCSLNRGMDRPEPSGLILLGVTAGAEQKAFRLLADLHARRQQRENEILMLAPGAPAHIIVSGYEIGASAVMTGPFDVAEIAARLRALQLRLSRRRGLKMALTDGLKASITDPLTGLYNRRFALPRLAQVSHGTARANAAFAVFVIDIDHFKAVNDRHGHMIGDVALKRVSALLQQTLRSRDLVARIGGEEFLAILPNTAEETATALADRLCQVVRDTPITLPGDTPPLSLTISVGVTMGKPGQRSPEQLIADADTALYTAKRSGRDRVVVHAPRPYLCSPLRQLSVG